MLSTIDLVIHDRRPTIVGFRVRGREFYLGSPLYRAFRQLLGKLIDANLVAAAPFAYLSPDNRNPNTPNERIHYMLTEQGCAALSRLGITRAVPSAGDQNTRYLVAWASGGALDLNDTTDEQARKDGYAYCTKGILYYTDRGMDFGSAAQRVMDDLARAMQP